MSLKTKIKKIWHDLFYRLASDQSVDFALTCKEATEKVDVGVSKKLKERLRLALHLSLCEGCHNYLKITQTLRRAIQNAVAQSEKNDRLENLNKELLKKHTTLNESKKLNL